MHFMYATLLLLLLYASYGDIRELRIPNWLCGLILILGLTWNSAVHSFSGFYNGLVGLMIGFVTFSIIRSITGMGAGDVKLMTAVGATVGFRASLSIVGYSIIISGSLAALYLILRKLLNARGCFGDKLPMERTMEPTCAGFCGRKYQMPMAPGITIATGYVLMPKLSPLTEIFLGRF